MYIHLDVELIRLLEDEQLQFTHLNHFAKRDSIANEPLLSYAPYLYGWLSTVEKIRVYRRDKMANANPVPDPTDP